MHGTLFHAITASASVLSLVIAALMWWGGDQQWPRTTTFFLLGGVGGLAGTLLGEYVHRAITAVYGAAGHVAGIVLDITLGGLAACIGIGLAGYVGLRLHRKKVSDRTLLAAAILPWTTPFVPGVVGSVLMFAVSAPAAVIGAVLTFALGGFH